MHFRALYFCNHVLVWILMNNAKTQWQEAKKKKKSKDGDNNLCHKLSY